MGFMDYVYIALAVVACLVALPWVIGLVMFIVGIILNIFMSIGEAFRGNDTNKPH
ncbi:hypothetical protein ACYTPF_16135 [Alteromonas sp. HB246098]